MADSRFFFRAGPFSLQDIARFSNLPLSKENDGDALIHDVAPLDEATEQCITFLDNPKYKDLLPTSNAQACFLREKHVPLAPSGMVLFVSDDPYRAYALTAQAFYPRSVQEGEIHPSAIIDESAELGKGVRIAAGAVIKANVSIGDYVSIGENAVIEEGVSIGEHTVIAPIACISHATIGNHVIIHRSVNIGQDGFGFAMGAGGHVKVPQLGAVVIHDDVEIGAGACIDRGAGPDTVIGKGAKIDNLVQIGHNVQIGEHAVIVAQVGVAGSSQIGDYAILAGQVGISGHITIGAGAKIAAQSGVVSDVPPGSALGGTPAVPVVEWHKQNIMLNRLVKKKK